ncbi:MAG: biotin--[acetyl-CoA-carboxylase] ligase [Gemmatimonadaceae bacterium]
MTTVHATSWDGEDAETLRGLLDVPRLELFASVPSTMDVAHQVAAEGAPAGTVVVADEQMAGRGRGGTRWRSRPGAGIWMTLIERPNDPDALAVLTIRLGLKAAPVLERYVDEPVQLKWPNDLLVRAGKLAGILVETRWRQNQVDWVAIGMGANVRVPDGEEGAGLRPGTRRLDVLAELLPALRAAVRARGRLSEAELARWSERDHAAGRRCSQPIAGRIQGLAADGSLIVESGGERAFARSGSLVLEEEA